MKQPATRTVPCPCCGHPTKVVNGVYLADLRERAGLTQRQFGKLVGASGPYVSDWERNRRAIPEHVVKVYRNLAKKEGS